MNLVGMPANTMIACGLVDIEYRIKTEITALER